MNRKGWNIYRDYHKDMCDEYVPGSSWSGTKVVRKCDIDDGPRIIMNLSIRGVTRAKSKPKPVTIGNIDYEVEYTRSYYGFECRPRSWTAHLEYGEVRLHPEHWNGKCKSLKEASSLADNLDIDLQIRKLLNAAYSRGKHHCVYRISNCGEITPIATVFNIKSCYNILQKPRCGDYGPYWGACMIAHPDGTTTFWDGGSSSGPGCHVMVWGFDSDIRVLTGGSMYYNGTWFKANREDLICPTSLQIEEPSLTPTSEN